MMKKLFNKKAMVVYIVILCITTIAGFVSLGLGIHYQDEFEASAAKTSNQATEAVTNAIAGLITALGGDSVSVEKEEKTYDSATKAFLNKRNASLIFMTVFFVLTVLFIAAAITSYQYEKYLLSYKYKAKLKRLKKFEKNVKAS